MGSSREREVLTGHAVPFRCREGRGVHVDDATWGEIVVFLDCEIEVPVFGVVGQERETVELAVRCDEGGDEGGVRFYVDGRDRTGEKEGEEGC